MRSSRAFSACHPVVLFTYFALVLLFTMFFMQPLCLSISLLCAAFCLCMLDGRHALFAALRTLLPLGVLTALINPLFSHRGETVLWYFPSGNPLTAESVLYGLCAALMVMAAILWFACCAKVMTSDKIVYLFGRVVPTLSLILSMTLRFVPLLRAQLRSVGEAQRALYGDAPSGTRQRLRRAVSVFSIVVTWSLEHAVETADSMRSRGYGLRGRTAFFPYRFTVRDKMLLLWQIACGAYVLAGAVSGCLTWSFYPTAAGAPLTLYSFSLYGTAILLMMTPVLLNAKEALLWKRLPSDI